MQLKKFEARSMKEALEMVKTQLGPDAIILSAKEITKGFGLGGERSIEVTAAYSEKVLTNKKFIESKMSDNRKEQFQHAPAKTQKEIMKKMIESQVRKMNEGKTSSIKNSETNLKSLLTTSSATKAPSHKITEKRYIDIDRDENDDLESSMTKHSPNVPTVVTQVAQKAWNDMEVKSLKQEIESLKGVITQFKNVPQNFVQAHPGADLGVHYSMSDYFQKLTAAGIAAEIAAETIRVAQNSLKPQQQANTTIVESWIAKYILDTTPITRGDSEQFHLFLGPSGSGKTSSLIKYASELILNQKKRVAIISTDTSKVGAAEQMKIFSQILNVPFLMVRSQQDWGHVIPHLENLDHVLVDYAGLNLRNQDEINYLKRMTPPVYKSLRTHLVLSSSSKDADLMALAERYQNFGYNDVIFTGLDEAIQHGNIYNFVAKTGAELFAFGIGTKVPEDFEYATAERLVDLILNITQGKRQEATT